MKILKWFKVEFNPQESQGEEAGEQYILFHRDQTFGGTSYHEDWTELEKVLIKEGFIE